MKKIMALAATALTTATLLSGAAPTAQARPLPAEPPQHLWDKRVHCKENDPDGRLEYEGVAFETGPHPRQVDYVVIVQYTRKTKDGNYDAGRGQKIGVINAFCRNQHHNKCPDWMNR